MKKYPWLILTCLIFLSACHRTGSSITIVADGNSYTLHSNERIPTLLIDQAQLSLGVNDRIIFLGSSIEKDKALPAADAYLIAIRRARSLTITLPDSQKKIGTSAFTIGQALEEAGYRIYDADRIDPPEDTPLDSINDDNSITVNFHPSSKLTLEADGQRTQLRTISENVGQTLSEAGLPLEGLDFSYPPEISQLPADGSVRIIRVSETVSLAQKTIPFGTRTELSTDLELDQQALLQGGEPGLKISRTRSRNEDGIQVSQISDDESIVRPPQDRVLGIGTKIVIRTANIDGVNIEYWRAMTLYATYYIPCIPGTNNCHYGTASGTRVRKGEAALVYPWYLLLAGENLYIPGYGYATVEDNNGANSSAYWGTKWIDLGYAQTDEVDWVNHYVTVYFLTPVPANIADLYFMP
jgi:uncharacterized protein YabE (DUF348 family)